MLYMAVKVVQRACKPSIWFWREGCWYKTCGLVRGGAGRVSTLRVLQSVRQTRRVKTLGSPRGWASELLLIQPRAHLGVRHSGLGFHSRASGLGSLRRARLKSRLLRARLRRWLLTCGVDLCPLFLGGGAVLKYRLSAWAVDFWHTVLTFDVDIWLWYVIYMTLISDKYDTDIWYIWLWCLIYDSGYCRSTGSPTRTRALPAAALTPPLGLSP